MRAARNGKKGVEREREKQRDEKRDGRRHKDANGERGINRRKREGCQCLGFCKSGKDCDRDAKG